MVEEETIRFNRLALLRKSKSIFKALISPKSFSRPCPPEMTAFL